VNHRPPRPTPAVDALPLTRPFVAPEELARLAGHTSLLRLGANESAFGPPPRALEAMRDALPRISWYGDPESTDLREALAARHRCTPENVVVGAGIDDLLGMAVGAYMSPGDVAVATLGTYPTFAYHVAARAGRMETIAYEYDGSVALASLFARAASARARIVYLANPDNPSGSFIGRATLERALAAVPSDVLFVLDEAYGDFAASTQLLPDEIDPRIVRMRTFSKAYGLAGARIGYALADRTVTATFNKIRIQYNVNRNAQIGALAALEEEPFVAAVVAEVADGREEYAALGHRLGLPTLPSLANFVNFDLGTRERAEAVLAALMRAGVFVRKPGAPPIDRCIRVTVGTGEERAAFATRLAEALDDVGAKSPGS
jgi:histidinol-phosphate aminotransferase